jgi:sarcosine oxidase
MSTPTSTADVIVVGLGAFGSAITWQLARRGLRVIGIDRHTPPHAHGSSHGASRITRLAVGEGEVYVPLVRRSNELWRELEAQGHGSLYERTGGLIVGPRDGQASHHGKTAFVQRVIATAQKFGIALEVLPVGDARRRFPQFAFTEEELVYFEPDSGVLRPEACIAAQLAAARAAGAVLKLDEPVVDIAGSGSGATVTTARGRYHAARVVISAGPWVPGMAGGAWARSLRVLRQVLYWYAPQDPALYAPERCPVFIWMHGAGDEDYMYGFPMGDGHPGVKVATEQYRESTDPDTVNRSVGTDESDAMHATHVAGRLQGVTARCVHSAVCVYTVSPDSGFVVDRHPTLDSVTVVSACSGHGFKHSAGLGEAIALRVIGEAPAGELEPFRMRF